LESKHCDVLLPLRLTAPWRPLKITNLRKDMLLAILFVMDIKTMREQLGLTQDELARKLGVSWGTIARWEGGRSKPSKLAQKAIDNLVKEEKQK